MWKKVPLKLRNRIHFLLHRINSNSFLLMILSFRHTLTCHRIAKLPSLKIRIGESRKFEGWVSANYQVFTRNFLDGRRPFHGVSNLSYVYLDNVIEHLTRENGYKMLSNIFLAMQSSGVIRLSTPDLKSICQNYLSSEEKYVKQLSHDLMNHGLNVVSMPDLLRVTFCAFGHEKGYIYDFDSIKLALEQIGFCHIKFCRVGESMHSCLNGIESRIGESDYWSQMCVEAIKP